MRKLKMEELDRLSIQEYKDTEKAPLVIILDNVRSLNNVGSAFRTSDAFLIDKIYLCGITGSPPNREIQKTALGATDSVEWEHVEHTGNLIRKLKRDGFRICSFEQADQSVLLHDFEPERSQKYALVFGNEVFGVDDEVLDQSDDVIEIPQLGTKHSLNISVTMGIAIWDFANKLGIVNK